MHNHFHILKLEPDYSLDQAVLHRAYLQVQQASHPDRQSGKSDAEKQKAALHSAAANDAYRVLKDDYLRAVHLLELGGIKVQGDDATEKPDQMLLMEVMEWNEAVEQASPLQAAELQAEYQAQREALIAQLHQSVTPKAVIRLGYLQKAIALANRKAKGVAA